MKRPSETRDPKVEALEKLKRARAGLTKAQEGYEIALVGCRDAGLSNVKIAKTLGVTETAVRTYLKRRAK